MKLRAPLKSALNIHSMGLPVNDEAAKNVDYQKRSCQKKT